MISHIWYFAKEDKLAIVDDNQHWYWDWFCKPTKGVIYLGEL